MSDPFAGFQGTAAGGDRAGFILDQTTLATVGTGLVIAQWRGLLSGGVLQDAGG